MIFSGEKWTIICQHFIKFLKSDKPHPPKQDSKTIATQSVSGYERIREQKN